MAVLEYKRRVRLPEDFFLDKRSLTRRPWPRWPLFAGGWLAFTGLCFAITTDRVPVGRWLAGALEPAAAAEPRATPPSTPSPALVPLPVAEPHRTETSMATPPDSAEQRFAEEPAGDQPLDPEVSEVPSAAAPLVAALDPDEPTATPTPPDSDEQRPAPPVTDDDSEVASSALPSPPDPDTAKPAPASQSSVGTSCEAAIASYQEEIRIGGPSAQPDLSRAQFASVLENGSYFSHCGVPESMSVEICAAVRNGRAVGVSIRTSPGSRAVQACVARAVRGLTFPAHPRMDVTRTRFAAQ